MKKTILILIDWYLPGRKAGGPVKSIESLVWAMKEEFHFKILTTDTDLGESLPYASIERMKWLKQADGSEVFYLPKATLNKAQLAEVINSTPHDIIYLNSFYSRWFSIVPLKLKKARKISGKIVLAPRGMLSEGALAIKKIKKKAFICLSKLSGLHRGITWHATYEKEVEEIRNFFGRKAVVKLCPNFSKPIVGISSARSKNAKELKLFFLSRVSRVKNLHVAFKTLKEMCAVIKDADLVFDIYGAIEDENYKEECLSLVKDLPSTVKIEFKGELKNENVGEVISAYHFLFLPTSNENFGHSIFEALQAGCPVIISNKTPWRNLEQLNCGWDLESEPAAYVSVLEKCYRMGNEEYRVMSEAAHKLAQEHLNIPGHREAALELFS